MTGVPAFFHFHYLVVFYLLELEKSGDMIGM